MLQMVSRLVLTVVALAASGASNGMVAVQEGSDDPVAFGKRRLAAADKAAPDLVEVVVSKPGEPANPESFSVAPHGRGARVEASDATGAMYALLELAERVRAGGSRTLATTTIRAAPFLRDRGLNVFLTLPWNYEKNDTDYDPAALVDPQRWWFQDEDYWSTLLDLMAESRLNWVDIHGSWDVSVTDAPNLYAYFIQSEKYPEVGVAPDIKAKNLAQLNHVIELAHARGIRVSLMAYEARLATPHRRNPPYPNDEATAYDYTRDVVEQAIRRIPGLDAIGFRIGESGHGGDFFNCYTEAVTRSGRDIPLVTRSWVTRKEKVVPLARASSDFTVEIKYNGEQWGAPWPFAGGRVASWQSYSFEDYLSDSGEGPARKTWPGQPVTTPTAGSTGPTGSSGRFPDQPYKIVWQVRANGTHRIFPFFEPDWVRRSIEPMRMGTANGFTVEPLNAYYPASPRYYVADASALPCKWVHQRDELWLMQWGRLGYDPKTPDAVFEQRLRERFGAVAEPLARAWRSASRIVPLTLLAHAFGPDHRDYAPELEWGGSTRDLIEDEGLDSHVFLPVRVEMALRATGGSDGRVSLLEVADELEELSAAAEKELPALAKAQSVPEAARLAELRQALAHLSALGRYHAGRFRAAWWTALADAAPGTAGARRQAADAMQSALTAWRKLAGEDASEPAFYRPFTDRLRMRTNTFAWHDQTDEVTAEAALLEKLAASGPPAADGGGERAPRKSTANPPSAADVGGPELEWRDERGELLVRLPAHGIERAWLLSKPLPSSTFFHKVAMEKRGETFEARLPRERCGHLLAAEIQREDELHQEVHRESQRELRRDLHRIPDWRTQTPWRVVPSQAGPTPIIYGTEEALDHLDPAVLSPARYGPLVVAPRAWDYFRHFDLAAQRKLLDAIVRGGTLIVLQQDYTSGRYPLAWLPDPPRVENFRSDLFDPAGALGLEVVRAADLLLQHFVPTAGWEVPGNGGIAHRRHGKGDIWMVQARLLQDLHLPGCARALVKILRSGGVERPLVIVDPGTEGGRYLTSSLPDLLNAHDVPFLTLGEVIAREQGQAPVLPGRKWDDVVLGGKGGDQLRAFVDAQARAAAARPIAKSREDFEAQRPAQKQLVMQALGLDPLPPRTPLNARITGVLERDGYRIEKVVFESRPGFPVTAHLYVPANANGKLPVIVNPHGHWQHKKSEPVVQQRMIQQALHGYLALILDTPGFSFEEEALIERRYAGSHFDLRNLLGSANTTAVYVWDMMRALDWLETRPEADMTRIGITGASGGGLATLWAFAADDRFTCAVPVVFATSLEVEPHNGCQCNHVPGTLRIGDRADALAVRAPAPVFVIGAEQDKEFPPAGTRRTGEKLTAIWSLFGAADRVGARVFPGPHDYNLDMVAAALGFFDKHLKGEGDGSPLQLIARPTEPAESREMLCLPEVPEGLTTMRAIAVAKLAQASKGVHPGDLAAFVQLNGGGNPVPAGGFTAWDELGKPTALPARSDEVGKTGVSRAPVTFESAKGLNVPGILRLPGASPRAGVLLVTDRGKRDAERLFGIDKLVAGGFACLALDPRGIGELEEIDLRLLVYAGTAASFAGGEDLARAAALLRPLCGRVGLVADGPVACQAALAAASLDPAFAFVVGRNALRDFADEFADDVPLNALQPSADRLAPLPALRTALPMAAEWSFRGDPEKDLFATLLRLLER